MKKWQKIILGIIGIIVLLFIIDLVCIFAIDRPIFAIKKDNGTAYKGIFYDTYNCEEYSVPQIKAKGTKFTCKEKLKVKEIVDTTKEIKNFSCDQALEKFHEDEKYVYSWGCIKNKYMLVRYENGNEETISNALKSGTITIKDLDKSNIDYIKTEKENNDEHSFLGKVIESHQSYIIVEPNENEGERKSADKFRIELGQDNDAIYEIGTNVKITYVGGINESYPAQIGTTKIEIKSTENFQLIFNQKTGNVKKQIVDKNTNKQYNYNVYVWNGDVQIIIDDKTYSLEEAINKNKITMDEIITKANKDIPNAPSYDDGGSIEYHYDNYTIIKFHKIDGNRDVYIGNEKLTIHDVK